jgi:signal transduction histidine kinase/ActR/RegA family two-component response regulator
MSLPPGRLFFFGGATVQEASQLGDFVDMLRHLREPYLIASRTGRIVGANGAAADALGTSVDALQSTSLACYSPAPDAPHVDAPRADASFPLRALDGRPLCCDTSVLAPDILLLRLSSVPEAAPRARFFLETLLQMRATAGGVSSSRTLEDLSRALLTHGAATMGAIAGVALLLDEAGEHLELKGWVGLAAESIEPFRRFPLTMRTPCTDAVRSEEPVLVGAREDLATRYPEFERAHAGLAAIQAIVAFPLRVQDRTIGAIGLGFPARWSVSDDDRSAFDALARQCGEVFDWAQRLEGERTSIEHGERAAFRLEQLHAFTRALARAITPAHVAEVVVDVGIGATRARTGRLWLLSEDGTTANLARSVGHTRLRAGDHARIPLEPPQHLPTFDSIRSGMPLWFESRQQFEAQYPGVLRTSSTGHELALACLPLFAQGRCIGELTFEFESAQQFGADERACMQVLAWHAAQAIERSRLYAAEKRAREAAEASQRRSDFLADMSTLLASSLDYSSTLAAVARAAVPRVADWCIVEIEELRAKGAPPVAAHVDPAKQPMVLELANGMRALLSRELDGPSVVRSGKPKLRPLVSAEELREWVRGDAALCELLERIGIVSSMVVPISARDRTLGVIVLNSADATRLYDEQDLAMAEELGRRAGLAMDNARLYRDAREADRQKDEFLAMLSHELRNPLTPIVTALEIMTMRGDEAYSKERAIISRHVKHVVRLVDDLLDVARVTRGKIDLRPELCELSSVTAKALEMASPLVHEREQHLAISVPTRGLAVRGDPARLAQVLANLVANAAKYTERGGRIGIDAVSQESMAVVRVHDSGIGIAPEALPRIFDLFVQDKRELDRAQGGLGIGLTVVKRLVELHGGSVSAHSDGRGKGSEFVVRLPLASDAVPEAARSQPSLVSPIVKPTEDSFRVLVVDDNADAADMLREALGVLGCAVQVAYDGAAALIAASGFAPDLALVDIGLPIMTGYELVGHLRRLASAPRRIVAVTGYGQEGDFVRSRAAGFDEHIVKPIEFSSLQELLDRSRRPESLDAPAF